MRPPRRPAILPTRELTLGDLLSTVEPERYPEAIAARLRALWPRPLGRLGAGDLHFLIGQGIGASLVLPLALELLERQPLLAAVGEPGDLLAAVFGVALPHVASREQLRRRAREVLHAAGRTLRSADRRSQSQVTLLAVIETAGPALDAAAAAAERDARDEG